MAEAERTERERLVEVAVEALEKAWREEGRVGGCGLSNRETAKVVLAAADLLSEEGEPAEDVTARALRSVVRRYKKKLDTSGDPAVRYTYRNVVDDLEGILRAADLRAEMRPGPAQEASGER